MKTVAIIGAGPAGLSTAYQLLKQSKNHRITIFEKGESVGGLSKSFEFEGGRVDIGGHRFFTKNEMVKNLWDDVLPNSDKGMLVRKRKSHILYNNKLLEYPLKLNLSTVHSLGFMKGIKAIISYLIYSRKTMTINTLEDFFVKRFGRELFSDFFEKYTYKLWGIPASELSPDWGNQRVQKVSLFRSIFFSNRKDERSLIKEFHYPALGCGQLWNELANKIITMGGTIETGCCVEGFELCNQNVSTLHYSKNGIKHKSKFDYVVSSMPLRELVLLCDNCPNEVKQVAIRLLYRDMIIVAVEIDKNDADTMLINAQSDCWLYIQDENISFGRVQILNNWSRYSVNNSDSFVLELEYFCNENDDLWNKEDNELLVQAITELISCGLCKQSATSKSYLIKRIEKAYPIYTDGYNQLNKIRDWADSIHNLRCIGRNGQHRYNNMDHSVETGIEAAKSILDKNYNEKWLWNVNSKQEYIEK